MIHALITGSLYRTPEQRASKNGRTIACATVRVKENETPSPFVKIFAFSESVQSELLRLGDGDSLSAQGRLGVETFITTSGTTKVSLSLVAEHVLALRQPPKKRAATTSAPPDIRTKQERQRGSWTGPDDGPCDEIPF
jgi:single-stranded DNA-binding protein